MPRIRTGATQIIIPKIRYSRGNTLIGCAHPDLIGRRFYPPHFGAVPDETPKTE